MKFLIKPISGQHLLIKAVILITGLVSGLDSSIIQLPREGALFLLFMLLEPAMYRSLGKALKTVLPFLAAYWCFSTLLGQEFPKSALFTAQVLYLLVVTVYVFARPDFSAWAHDCRWLRRIKCVNTIFVFGLSTLLFVRRLFAEFRLLRSEHQSPVPVAAIGEVFTKVASDSDKIGSEVQRIMESQAGAHPQANAANALGITFLAILVIIHGV